MTSEELIESLTILKEQAQNYGDNTFIWSINIDSFKFVIDSTIKALEQEPTTNNDLGVDCIDRAKAQTEIEMKASRYTIAKERGGMGQVEWSDQLIKVSDAVDIIRNLPSVTPQEPVIDKINKMKSEIADSLEFWDYSPNNNPLARDMLETLTNFWGDIREVKG